MRKQILKLFLFLLVFFMLPNFASAANFPLEITNIKPAGTGSPAIPATNRIFRAYPGIEYNIRAAVIGGMYPFKFLLSNAPVGMIINEDTGEISWPNPQANSGTITLSVTDAENTVVTTSWAIAVSTVGFYFVDANAPTNGTGAIASPFNSLSNMIAGTGAAHLTDILYFRGGNYPLVASGTDCGGVCNSLKLTDNAPFTWIGYPNEAVNISGNNDVEIRAYQFWYDNLNFSDFNYHGIEGQGGRDFQTIRRCKFINLVAVNTGTNLNEGFIYINRGTPQGYGLIIQDNEFSYFTGGSGIGSLYDTNKALIEDNYIHDAGGIGVGSGVNSAIGIKDNDDRMTVRHNKIIIPNGVSIFGNAMNAQMAEVDDLEVAFNYFNIGANKLAHEFFERPDLPQKVLYYYRNTLVGALGFAYIDGSNCTMRNTVPLSPLGAVEVKNNILINTGTVFAGTTWILNSGLVYHPTSTANSPWLCVTDVSNLKSASTTGIIDSDGLLVNRSDVGIYGWEAANGSGDVFAPSAPSGLSVM
ncbi:MAG: hypothetical protein HGA36_03805 [Candidatus Moranbacteria bacterium]|nr:hypothetical protein [Candidatus Moranbacteria bacterium]